MNSQSRASKEEKTIRCLLGMLGTDVHTKGIRTLAHLLRNEGIEVIYIGNHNTCEGMVQAMIDEDVDIAGVSYSSPNYLDYSRKLTDLIVEKGIGDVPVMVGGLIHEEDFPALQGMGVKGIFGPGSRIEDIVRFIHSATST